jgi:hypothetical protein
MNPTRRLIRRAVHDAHEKQRRAPSSSWRSMHHARIPVRSLLRALP